MARSRARIFGVESLEGKQLLSAMQVTHHAPARPPALVLNGTLKDPVANIVFNGDATQTEEKFTGSVKGMGAVQGELTIVTAPLSWDRVTAVTLALTNSKGSVTLGYGQNSVISTTDLGTKYYRTYRFTVQSGTGRYSGVSGAGTFMEYDDLGVAGSWGFPYPVTLTLHTTHSH
jgi:hypothetical protein